MREALESTGYTFEDMTSNAAFNVLYGGASAWALARYPSTKTRRESCESRLKYCLLNRAFFGGHHAGPRERLLLRRLSRRPRARAPQSWINLSSVRPLAPRHDSSRCRNRRDPPRSCRLRTLPPPAGVSRRCPIEARRAAVAPHSARRSGNMAGVFSHTAWK